MSSMTCRFVSVNVACDCQNVSNARSNCCTDRVCLFLAATFFASLLAPWLSAQQTSAPANANARLCSLLCGAYEVGPGWLVGVSSEDSDLIYQDFQTGRLGLLRKTGDRAFTAGPTLMDATPVLSTFRFIEDSSNRITALVIEEQGRPTRTANKLNLQQTEVKIQNGEIALAGELISSDSRAVQPGIVIIPGGGPQKRDLLQSWWWAYNGFTVLTYDKRGAGRSMGTSKQASILDLAEDAIAAVRMLRHNGKITKGQVGIIGHSEGGFVAPVVASRLKDLSFVIALAPSLFAMPQQVVHEVGTTLQCQGFSADDISRAKTLRDSLNRTVLANGPWPKLASDIQAAEKEKWFREARVTTQWKKPSADMIEANRRYLDFEPASFWIHVRAPVLAIYGEVDTQIATAESQKSLQSALRKAQHHDHIIQVFPKTNHIFLEADSGCSDEYSKLSRIVPGYFHTLITWTLRHVR